MLCETCRREGVCSDYASFARVGCEDDAQAEELQVRWTKALCSHLLKHAQGVLADSACSCILLQAGRCVWAWNGKLLRAQEYAAEACKAAQESKGLAHVGRDFEHALRLFCHALLCPDVERALAKEEKETHANMKRRELEGLASATAQIATAFGFVKAESFVPISELAYLWHNAGLTD